MCCASNIRPVELHATATGGDQRRFGPPDMTPDRRSRRHVVRQGGPDRQECGSGGRLDRCNTSSATGRDELPTSIRVAKIRSRQRARHSSAPLLRAPPITAAAAWAAQNRRLARVTVWTRRFSHAIPASETARPCLSFVRSGEADLCNATGDCDVPYRPAHEFWK
jgi:hypothetical protein